MEKYNPHAIEAKWQRFWEEKGFMKAKDLPGGRGKQYVLVMFPYPSGAGLHIGHPEGYTATDILARLEADHFAVLLPNCDHHYAQIVGEKMRSTVAGYRLRWGKDSTKTKLPICGHG